MRVLSLVPGNPGDPARLWLNIPVPRYWLLPTRDEKITEIFPNMKITLVKSEDRNKELIFFNPCQNGI